MSYINPFNSNLAQTIPQEIIKNLILHSYNSFPGSNLQYNPFLFANNVFPQIAGKPQINDYQGLILSQLAMSYPGIINPSQILANQLYGGALNCKVNPNVNSIWNHIINQNNKNSSTFNLNMLYYLQNNSNFLKILSQQNQALSTCKINLSDNGNSNTSVRNIINNDENINGNRANPVEKKDEMRNNQKMKKSGEKKFLKQKTKRNAKKTRKLDSDDEDEYSSK
jgi:hypothetical protein